MSNIASIVTFILVFAAMIVSIILSTLGLKAFANDSKTLKGKELNRSLISGKIMLGLIIASGILLLSNVVSLIAGNNSFAAAITYVVNTLENGVTPSPDTIIHLMTDILIPALIISAYESLLISSIFFFVYGKKGKLPFGIIGSVFFALFIFAYAAYFAYDFIDIVDVLVRLPSIASSALVVRAVFTFIAMALLIVAAITFIIKIKDIVKNGLPVFKGATGITFTIALIIPFVCSLTDFIISVINRESWSTTAPGFMLIGMLTALFEVIAICGPITYLLSFSTAASKLAMQAGTDSTEEKVQEETPTSVVTPVVAKEVKKENIKVATELAPASTNPTEPVWREKKDASGKPVDASGKAIEQFATNRGIVKFFFLSLITFSIYGLVIMCKVTGELRIVREGHGKDKPLPYFAMIVLTPLTLGIVPLVWNHKMAKRLQEECEYRGIASPIKPWQFWVFAILLSELLFFPFYYQAKFFIASNQINAHHNKYGDKKVRVVVKTAEPKQVEAKPVEVIKPVEKVVQVSTPVIDTKPIEQAKPVTETKPETASVDPMAKLQKAKAMLDAGLITQEEYDEVKAKALADL